MIPGEYRSTKLNNGAYTPDVSPIRGGARRKSSGKRAESLYDEIRKQIDTNWGEELPGMTNPKVLKPLFRKQTCKWEDIGQAHLKRLVSMSSDVATKILDEVCAELGVPSHTKNELENMICDFKDAKEEFIKGKLHVFCQENSTFPLQTNNKLFPRKVEEAQRLRFKGALERYRKKNPPENFISTLSPDRKAVATAQPQFSSWAIVDVNNLNKLFDQMHPHGVQNTEDEIHDLLKAYYEASPIPLCPLLCI